MMIVAVIFALLVSLSAGAGELAAALIDVSSTFTKDPDQCCYKYTVFNHNYHSVTAFRIGLPECPETNNIKKFNQCRINSSPGKDAEYTISSTPARANANKDAYFEAIETDAEWLEINGRGWIWDVEIPAYSSKDFKICLNREHIKIVNRKCTYYPGTIQAIDGGSIVTETGIDVPDIASCVTKYPL